MSVMLNEPAADRFTLVHGSVVSLSFMMRALVARCGLMMVRAGASICLW